jgi:ribosomal protein L37AE/L43A
MAERGRATQGDGYTTPLGKMFGKLIMTRKPADHVRCVDCGAEIELTFPLMAAGADSVWCCRTCGAEVSEASMPVREPLAESPSRAADAADARSVTSVVAH